MPRSLPLACFVFALATVCQAQPSPLVRNNGGDNIVVACPTTEQPRPMFKDTRTGNVFPIVDPLLRAVAAKACEPDAGETATPPVNNVSVTNNRGTPIYVSFTVQNQTPGPIAWTTSPNCVLSGVGIQIAAGQTCSAYVPPSAGSSRFCAALSAAPANCYVAQTNHQTMIETNFLPASNGGCFGQGACVWYDISLIPSNCTDSAWAANECAGTGGASYNLPVQTSCGGTATYTCQGPTSTAWGPENYPSSCGNPNATCTGNSPGCVNAYFFPMFSGTPSTHQPNQGCYGTSVFGITFLSGS